MYWEEIDDDEEGEQEYEPPENVSDSDPVNLQDQSNITSEEFQIGE